MAESSRHKRSTGSREDQVPELPEECINKIFSHMPVPKIEASVKCLSKGWEKAVREPSFVEQHLSQSKPGLLLQDYNHHYSSSGRIRHFTVENGIFKMTNVERGVCFQILNNHQRFQPPGGHILASSDGVVLILLFDATLLVANLLKKILRRIHLPDNVASIFRSFCSIGRVPQTGEFKVLCLFRLKGKGLRWCITTIGADQSWREINLTTEVARRRNHRKIDIISCSGIIYLDQSSSDAQHNTFAIDLSDESVHRIQVPNYSPPHPGEYEVIMTNGVAPPMDSKFLVMRDDNDYYLPLDGRFVAMRNKISFIAPEQHGNNYELRIYTMSEFRNSCWEVCNIFVHPDICRMYIKENAVPIAWLDDNDVLICRVRKEKVKESSYSWYAYGLVAYYVKTGKRRLVPKTEVSRMHRVKCHTNSLVWFHPPSS